MSLEAQSIQDPMDFPKVQYTLNFTRFKCDTLKNYRNTLLNIKFSQSQLLMFYSPILMLDILENRKAFLF